MPAKPKRARRGTGGGGRRKAARRQARGGAPPRSEDMPTQEADARVAFFDQARPYTRYLGVEIDEGRYVVSTRSEKLSKHLFTKQGRPEFGVLRRAVAVLDSLLGEEATTGSVFVDVGANLGTSTISALVSHRFGSAVCIEPEDENYRLLRANLALNDLDHVRTVRAAASDHIGHAKLVVYGGPPGKTWVALDDRLIENVEVRRAAKVAEGVQPHYTMTVSEVELVTLDQLVEDAVIDPARVGMLWIDVEGHEGHVLAGAQSLTERGVPIVFEFDPEILQLRGDRSMIHKIAAGHYTHFVDLRRREADPAEPRYQLRPATELTMLAERFLDPALPASYTDLLMLRLDAEQARVGADLPDLMSRTRATTERSDG